MGRHGIDDAIYLKAKQIVYGKVKWSQMENQYNAKSNKGQLKLSNCVAETVKKSSLGVILNIPADDRSSMLELTETGCSRSNDFFTRDIDSLIERAINSTNVFDLKAAFKMLTNLSLIDCGISEIDDVVRALPKLRFLSLPGNRITRISGTCLPRRLQFLELYNNEVQEVRSLYLNLPKNLLHLGLARNKLSDDSGIHLFGLDQTLNLRSLDLADNDISDLTILLSGLSGMRFLCSLKLEGNPCSMSYLFKKAVECTCPNLLYLDDHPLCKKGSRTVKSFKCLSPGLTSGTLCFYCYRVAGLPEPAEELWENKQVNQAFHVDIDIPLFDPVKRVAVINRLLREEGVGDEEQEEEVWDEKKESESSSETEDDVLRFCTPRRPWKDIIEYPSPSIRVRVPYYARLTELRDVFRTAVTIRIVHTKWVNVEDEDGVEPKEKILSTSAVAEFDAHLESIPWWLESLNYEWKTGDKIATLVSCSGKKEEDKESNENSDSAEVPVTCAFGFGVQRKMPDPVRDVII